MTAFTDLDLAQLPPPEVIQTVDFEAHWQAIKTLINGQYPLFLDEALQPTIEATQQIETDNGTFWAIAADKNQSRYAVDLPVDPLPRALMVKAYLDILVQQNLNETVRSVLPAYATGTDLDHIALRFGVVRQSDEDDERLRRRMLLAQEAESAGGSEGWYLYHVLSADPQVKDAVVTSPNPCEILITVLSTEGNGTASQGLLDTVEDAVNEQYTRVLGDQITVQSATAAAFAIDATLTFYPITSHENIIASIEAAWVEYLKTAERIGHDITESAVHAVLHQAGVFKVAVSTILPIAINDVQAPYNTGLNLIDGGEVA